MERKIKVLVIDDDVSVLSNCNKILTKEGYKVDTLTNIKEGIQKLYEDNFHAVIFDLMLLELVGMEILKKIKDRFPDIIIIIVTKYSSVESAVECIKLGAIDYIPKPFSPMGINHIIKNTLDKKSLSDDSHVLKAKNWEDNKYCDIIGKSDEMHKIFDLIKKVAETDSTVLITGESGTGKELIARAIYKREYLELC